MENKKAQPPLGLFYAIFTYELCRSLILFNLNLSVIASHNKRGKYDEVFLLTLTSISLLTSSSLAETTMSQEGQYIFNSLAFYIGGVLVAFMAAGFCMLESGLVTTKSVSTIAAKNIGKFAICSLVFFLVGYNLAYGIPGWIYRLIFYVERRF